MEGGSGENTGKLEPVLLVSFTYEALRLTAAVENHRRMIGGPCVRFKFQFVLDVFTSLRFCPYL